MTNDLGESAVNAAEHYLERRGQLPDGTVYLIRTPHDWNGILIRDLDLVSGSADPVRTDRFQDMVHRGYAVAGTERHRLRQWQYDPVREIQNLDIVLDLFEAEWGKPRLVLQYGCSGGGHVALAVAEAFSERIDGSIAKGTHTPVWLMNTFLDGWLALKTLLTEYYVKAGFGDADDLRITNLPNDGSANANAHGMHGKLPDAWRNAFQAAHATQDGKARMALAFAIGQWSPWLGFDSEEPDFDDADALQESIFLSAMQMAQSPGGEARIMFENAAQGQQLSWNNDVDYRDYFSNAATAFKSAVEDLYDKSGLDLESDIAMINDSPRIEASEHALAFWKQPGRNIYGDPKIPVLRLHMIGDYQVPYSLVQGYADALAANGKTGMARIAFVTSTGHCNFLASESAAAIETMVERIDTGEWPDTSPENLNVRAKSLISEQDARFTALGPYAVQRFNRTWLPH